MYDKKKRLFVIEGRKLVARAHKVMDGNGITVVVLCLEGKTFSRRVYVQYN